MRLGNARKHPRPGGRRAERLRRCSYSGSPVEESAKRGLAHMGPRRQIAGHRHITSDGRCATDCHTTQNRRSRVYHYVVFHYRMSRHALYGPPALVKRERASSKRDSLIEAHAVADDARLADNDARTVIDEEARPDLGTRV